MTGRISLAATLGACVMLALVGIRDDSGLLYPAGVLALIGYVTGKRALAARDEATLRAHGLKRLRVGHDTLYVQREEEDKRQW
jgi:hypothetical protein